MKATVLTYSVSRADGGIFEVTRRTAQSLLEQPGMSVEVMGLEDAFTQADLPQWRPVHPKTFRYRGPRLCGYTPGLADALQKADADVLHIHGIWSYYTLAGYRWSKRRQRPYMLTMHGMLSATALQVARWKKMFADAVFKNTVLRSARCLQAFTECEAMDIRRYGLRNPVCIIPNGVDLPTCTPSCLPPWHGRVEAGRKVLLYLGRLHPIKGLPNLLRAWVTFQKHGGAAAKDWNLVLAGWGQNGHDAELKAQVEAARIGRSVHFIGPQHGDAKNAAYHYADAFVLPSHSEGLPTVVLEAWANRLPVLMTPECSLPEGFRTGAALRIETSPTVIADGLEKLAAMTEAERQAMGQRGRKLVAERFTWPEVASEMRAVYEWMTGQGSKPECVRMD